VITDELVVFPNNVVSLVATRVGLLDPDLTVLRRPLRESDPVQSAGVFATQWLPDEESHEMKGLGHDPSIDRYNVALQAFVKDMDEERGLAVHSVMSEMLRTMLYRDTALRVGLSSLSTNLNGVQKRTTRWGISTQRYFSNELQGSWLYLSTLEFWLETETT
jgi:hypothetical protein